MEKRSSRVVMNLIWELGYYLIVIVLGFLAPRFIILAYGSEVNGLSSTITQIVNVILLLQAGATTASVYTLYRPIAEEDFETVSRKIASAERFFRKISGLFFLIMLVVAGVATWLIKSSLEWKYILIAFLIMGLKSFLDLYYTSKFRVVFTAFQQKFVVSIATLIEQIVYYVLVFITIYFKWNFLLLYIWFLIGCIVKVLYLNFVYRKKFSSIIPKYRGKTYEQIQGRNYSLLNEVSHSIVSSSVTIILSFMYGLEEASIYAIYALVSSALDLISTSIYSAFAPSFADLCVEKEKGEAGRVFGIFQYIFIAFNGFLMMCFAFLILPFIDIYTQGAIDINYKNSLLAILIAVNGLCSAYRIPYNIIVSSLGFFKQTWLQPVVTMAIALILSIVLGGINYAFILIGPIVFYLTNFLYQYFKLKKLTPHLISKEVFKIILITCLGVLIMLLLSRYIVVPTGIIWWGISAIACAVVSGLYFLLTSYLFMRKQFLATIQYVKRLLKKRG